MNFEGSVGLRAKKYKSFKLILYLVPIARNKIKS